MVKKSCKTSLPVYTWLPAQDLIPKVLYAITLSKTNLFRVFLAGAGPGIWKGMRKEHNYVKPVWKMS